MNPKGSHRAEFPSQPFTFIRAQFATKEAKSIDLLRPTLHIIEYGKTIQQIGPEGFKQVWNTIPSDGPAIKAGDGVAQPNSGNRAEVLGAAGNAKHVNPFQKTQVQSEPAQGARVPDGADTGYVEAGKRPTSNSALSMPADPAVAKPGASYGLTTVFPFNGQTTTAWFTVRNNGDAPVAVRLQFVDTDEKVLVQRDVTIKPGGDEAVAFGNNPVDVPSVGFGFPRVIRAQFGSDEPNGFLQPSLRIVDDSSGKTIELIGPEGFTEFTGPNNPLGQDQIRKTARPKT
jgi:hypothetical protein